MRAVYFFAKLCAKSMKRTGSDAQIGASAETPLKRVNSMGSAAPEDEGDDSTFFLRSQNRSLALELRKSKSLISESRRELDMMRSKSREMETLVGVIQRSWSQVSLFSSSSFRSSNQIIGVHLLYLF